MSVKDGIIGGAIGAGAVAIAAAAVMSRPPAVSEWVKTMAEKFTVEIVYPEPFGVFTRTFRIGEPYISVLNYRKKSFGYDTVTEMREMAELGMGVGPEGTPDSLSKVDVILHLDVSTIGYYANRIMAAVMTKSWVRINVFFEGKLKMSTPGVPALNVPQNALIAFDTGYKL